MTPQGHIDAIGKAQVALEEYLADVLDAARFVEKQVAKAEKQAKRVHYLQDKAQRAFKEKYPDDNVVLFSGGIDKPPAVDPDAP